VIEDRLTLDEHSAIAYDFLAATRDLPPNDHPHRAEVIAKAQVHATLAVAAALREIQHTLTHGTPRF
jgi:hypothetical protein